MVKRYGIQGRNPDDHPTFSNPCGWIAEMDNGKFVLYSDYAALEEENRRLVEGMEEIIEVPYSDYHEELDVVRRIARRVLGKEK